MILTSVLQAMGLFAATNICQRRVKIDPLSTVES